MIRSSDITSFTEFRAKLRDHLDQAKATNRPLFVTTNGETEAVVLSPAAFDKLQELAERIEIQAMIEEGLEDIKAGRTMPVNEAFQQIADRLGLKWDR